jgi:parallel beta-helix repeat protein
MQNTISQFEKLSSGGKDKLCIIFIFLTIFFSVELLSKDYYLSTSDGNDSYSANQAQNPATPWKSIDKLNNSMDLFNPGDIIYFKRGDVFTGQIVLTRSGSSTANIIFDAYGTGSAPVINGNVEINSWIHYNGNIWVANCPQLVTTATNFLLNKKSQQMGRYPNADTPNKGYLNIDSHSGNLQLSSNSLLSPPNWTGAEAVVRTRRWMLDRVLIQSHQGNTLKFGSATSYDIWDNYGFFIQNHLGTLDQDGEWYFDSVNKKIFLYHSTDPNSLKAEVTAYSSAFISSYQQHFSIKNLEFSGSFKACLYLYSSSYFEIKNNTISHSGQDAVYIANCNNIVCEGNNIHDTNNNALAFFYCNNIQVRDNEIRNTGLRGGSGVQNEYTGVVVNDHIKNCLLENNNIDSVGFDGIFFGGDSIIIRNNYIANFCMTIDDGAGIDTRGEEFLTFHNRRLQNNLIFNGIGAGIGTDDPSYTAAEGIYLDDRTSNVEIINNTVAFSSRGIFIHNSNSIDIKGNTLYSNNTQILLAHDHIAPTYPITNCKINGNIFFSKYKSQEVANFRTIGDDISAFGDIDNNFYCRPIEEDKIIFTQYVSNSVTVSNYLNLAQWQAAYNHDINSKKSPYPILPFRIAALIGSNIFLNGNFNNDITGWSSWSNYNNANISLDNTNKLDGGSLKLSFNSSSGKPDSFGYVIGSIGKVVAGENSILRFSMITSSSTEKSLKVYMGKDLAPYNYVAPPHYMSVDNRRKEFEMLFTPDSTEATSRLVFEVPEEVGPIWIDNVELNKAEIILANIDDSLKFYYNNSNQAVTYHLNENYVDVNVNKYSDGITLQSFTSAILMQEHNQNITFINTSPSDYNPLVKIYPNPARNFINVTITDPTSTYNNLEIMNILGQVLYNIKLFPDNRELKIPIKLINGIYFVLFKFNGRIDNIQKLIVSY